MKLPKKYVESLKGEPMFVTRFSKTFVSTFIMKKIPMKAAKPGYVYNKLEGGLVERVFTRTKEYVRVTKRHPRVIPDGAVVTVEKLAKQELKVELPEFVPPPPAPVFKKFRGMCKIVRQAECEHGTMWVIKGSVKNCDVWSEQTSYPIEDLTIMFPYRFDELIAKFAESKREFLMTYSGTETCIDKVTYIC